MERLTTLRVLWGAILASSLMLFGVMLAVAPEGGAEDPAVLILVAVAAIGSTVASLVLPPLSYRAALRRLVVETREEHDPTQIEGLAVSRVAKNPKAAASSVLSVFVGPYVIGLALSEAVGVFGMIVGMLGYSFEGAMPFFVTSWALLAMRFPSAPKIFGPAEALTGIHFPLGRAN